MQAARLLVIEELVGGGGDEVVDRRMGHDIG